MWIGSSQASNLGEYGATHVLTVDGAEFASGSTGAWVRALQTAVEQVSPAFVLAAASAKTREALPRLAARLGAGMASECTDLRTEEGRVVGRRPMYAGKAFADVKIVSDVAFFTVRPNHFGRGTGRGQREWYTAQCVASRWGHGSQSDWHRGAPRRDG